MNFLNIKKIMATLSVFIRAIKLIHYAFKNGNMHKVLLFFIYK